MSRTLFSKTQQWHREGKTSRVSRKIRRLLGLNIPVRYKSKTEKENKQRRTNRTLPQKVILDARDALILNDTQA